MRNLKTIESFKRNNEDSNINLQEMDVITGGRAGTGTAKHFEYSTGPASPGGDTDCGHDMEDDYGNVIVWWIDE